MNEIMAVSSKKIQELTNYEVPKQTPENYNLEYEKEGFDISKVADLTRLSQRGQEYYGSHPIHGSETDMNFWVNTSKNIWFCFRHQTGGGPLSLIAVQEGIIDCKEATQGALRGQKFIEVKKIAKQKYGFEFEEKTEPNQTLNFILMKDILKMKKQKGFVIEGIILPNTINQIFAKSGHFKSTLLLYMAICITQGKKVLGRKTKKIPIAFLDKENDLHYVKERAEKIYKGLKIRNKNGPLHFLSFEGMLDDYKFVESLIEYINEKKIKLVCFDTLIRFHEGEENSAKDINKLYDAFVKIKRETGATIIFLHHAGKNGEYRGSSDMKGLVDNLFKMERENDTSPFFTMQNKKNRSGEISDIYGEIIHNDDTIIIRETDDPKQEEQKEKDEKFEIARGIVIEFILKEVSNGEKFTSSDLNTYLEAWNIDNPEPLQISKKTLSRARNHLSKIKVLRNGPKKTDWAFVIEERDKVEKWFDRFKYKKNEIMEKINQNGQKDLSISEGEMTNHA